MSTSRLAFRFGWGCCWCFWLKEGDDLIEPVSFGFGYGEDVHETRLYHHGTSSVITTSLRIGSTDSRQHIITKAPASAISGLTLLLDIFN
jgi:hypothetical protein